MVTVVFNYARIHIFKLPQLISMVGLVLALAVPLVGAAANQLDGRGGNTPSQPASALTVATEASSEGLSATFTDLPPTALVAHHVLFTQK